MTILLVLHTRLDITYWPWDMVQRETKITGWPRTGKQNKFTVEYIHVV